MGFHQTGLGHGPHDLIRGGKGGKGGQGGQGGWVGGRMGGLGPGSSQALPGLEVPIVDGPKLLSIGLPVQSLVQ